LKQLPELRGARQLCGGAKPFFMSAAEKSIDRILLPLPLHRPPQRAERLIKGCRASRVRSRQAAVSRRAERSSGPAKAVRAISPVASAAVCLWYATARKRFMEDAGKVWNIRRSWQLVA